MAILRGTDKPNRFALYDGPTDGSDTIYGFGGDDIIWGLGGNDHLIGGEGGDYIDGGPGFDTAYYDDSTEGVLVDLTAGVGQFGTAERDTLISIEALVGSRFNDIFLGRDDTDNAFRGMDGIDEILGLGGNDWIQGGAGGDLIDGGDGYDYADYSDSAEGVTVDLLTSFTFGGSAAGDTLISIEGLFGSAFADWLGGNNGGNFLYGGLGDDFLSGAGGADGLNGESGDDTLDGGAGADVLNGGPGSDSAAYVTAGAGLTASLQNPSFNTGDASGDIYVSIENLRGSSHNDVLQGDDHGNVLLGSEGADLLDGLGGDDRLLGGAQDDWLFGGDGDDGLNGNEGNDVLYGGMNGTTIDILDGGAGADRFVWNSLAETGSAGIYYDEIWRFNATEGDHIDLSAIDANDVMPGRQHFTFIGNIGSGSPGRGQIGYNESTNCLVMNNDADADIDGGIFLFASVGGPPNASWFIL